MKLTRLFWGRGRMGRGAYAATMICLLAAGWLAHPLWVAIARTVPASMGYAAVGMLAIDVAILWMIVCVVAQRLHDVGRGGWWQLAPLGVLILGAGLAQPAWASRLGLTEVQAEQVLGLAALVYLGFLVALGCVRTRPGGDRFGQPGGHPS
ncbi:MAG: DUF805 domain-containing protein [Caulobacterales bacterium]|nr:DUF805 domain-containing protein [Caulobacterales bacterium]